MQYSVLFRKLVIENKIYYQLYDIKKDFQVTEKFGDFNQRLDKDYFYVNIGKNKLSSYQSVKYSVYEETDKDFNDIKDEKKISEVLGYFKAYFKDFNYNNEAIRRLNKIEMLVNKEVLFQEEAIYNILDTIFLNQAILDSDIPEKEKISMKDNIVLYGPSGNGKSSIIESLKKHLSIPYAEIFLTPDLSTNIRNILQQFDVHNNDIDKGIVFVKDNFEALVNMYDELADNPLLPLASLQHSMAYVDKNKFINFSKLTFITLVNIDSKIQLEEFKNELISLGSNNSIILVDSLNMAQKKQILIKNPNSRLNIYRTMLKNQGRKLSVSKEALDYLIKSTHQIQSGMHLINNIIDEIVKNEWHSNNETILITNNKVKELIDPIINAFVVEKDNPEKAIPVSKKEMDFEILLEKVKNSICSQDDQVKRILYTILRNQKIATSKDIDNPKRYIKNILLRGESGAGKTAILNRISELLDIPFYTADATRYTEAGYKGDDVENMLIDLYHASGDNLERAERGILNIDEIDKKANGGDIDISRGAVLNSLLKIVEGTKIPLNVGKGLNEKTIMFDTSRLTVICSGAFEKIEQIRDSRIGVSKAVGFGSKDNVKGNLDPNIIDEDYVNFGMSRQFMARLGVIVNLNNLMPKDLKNIMINSNLSELVIQKKSYDFDDVEFVYNDDFYDELSLIAYNKKIGARGIEKAFQDVLTSIRIMDIDLNKYKQIIFTKECIADPSKLILVEREKIKVKTL